MASSGPPPPNSRDDFEIAVVCALPIEYDAVTLLVDKFWDEDGNKYGRAIGDLNTYTTGRMGTFDIVLLLLPNAGKVSAASAASSFRTSFPNITLALLVGTCGGVPCTKDNEEILLGDVVISKTVIQYDLGSQYTGQFLTKETLEERLGRPDPNIRGIVHIMETDHERERLKNRAEVLLEQLQSQARRKKMRKPVNYEYEYPGILKDRLFRSSYVHKHQVLLPFRCCEEAPCNHSHMLSCNELGCEDNHLVERQRLNDQAQNLSIFIGRFGSGDTILNSGIYRDQVAQRHGLLAFEMEGAGIWDELPCIIVKGISNYADGHWNADSNWQHFAAATAAATARALIERYPKTDKPHLPRVLIEDCRKRTKEEEECLRDMHITDPALDKKRIEDTNGGLLKDSYIWILSNADFMRWRDDPDGGFLWIKGDPGKGKTMLLCGLIDELQADDTTRPYYFFCQASDSRLNSATKVLCSLVNSIACQDQEALSFVMEKYRHAGRELFHNTNSWTALSQVMTQILRKVNLMNSVFIIDGLDECIIDLPLLLDFIARAPGLSMAKWIVSSRNWPSIEERLNTSSKKLLLSLELNEQSISHAVQVYITYKVNQLALRKKLDKLSRDAVGAYLSAKANGTFLWVSLVYKELFKGDTRKRHFQDLITAFPPELGPLYMRMMAQVCKSKDAKICIQVLEMISLTYRPISLVELASLLNICEDNDDFDELRDVIATCGSFLVLKDDMVYFVHQSAKDFLLNNTSNQIFTGGIALKHHDIFSRSVNILSQNLRRDMYNLRHPGAQKRDASAHDPDPLAPLRYACLFWVDHLRDTEINSFGQTASPASLQDEGTVHSFLKVYLLQWLEVFCLMGKLSEGIITIRTLESLTTQDLGLLHMFLRDARRFVLSFRSAIEYTPLQLYSSALLFTPTSSIVRQTFEIHTAPWIAQIPSVQFEWNARLQVLEGHRDHIRSLVFSPDNTKLASYSSDGNLRIWDRGTGTCLESLMFNTFEHMYSRSMAFSPDSNQLALACRNCIKVLDLNTSACITTLNTAPNDYPNIVSPNGRHLILSNEYWEDGSFQVWDLRTGMQLQKEGYYKDVREPAVVHLDVSYERAMTVIRSPITGSRVQVVSKDRPRSVVFTLDGTLFALRMSGEDSRTIYILDAATGKCLSIFGVVGWNPGSLAFSPDGTLLAMVYVGQNIQIWDVQSGASLLEFSTHTYFNSSVAFSPDGTELAYTTSDESITIRDLSPGAFVDRKEEIVIGAVTYSPDTTRLALIPHIYAPQSPFTIEIWDSVEGIRQQQLQVGEFTVASIHYRDVKQRLRYISYDTQLLAFSPDNAQLAYSRTHEFAIRVLATNTSQNKFYIKVSGIVKSIIFSPSSARLAVADNPIGKARNRDEETTRVKIWDVINGVAVLTLCSAKAVTEMCFSSDSRRLMSASGHCTAAIWDLDTGTCLQILDIPRQRLPINAGQSFINTRALRRAQYRSFIAAMLLNPDSMHRTIHEFDPSSNEKWLLRRGEPFLWLPPEYRSQDMTFAGGNIAIILRTGTLLLLSFSLTKLDAEMASNRSSILEV